MATGYWRAFALTMLLAVSGGADDVRAQISRLGNISTRSPVLTGDHVQIGGFVVQGGPQTVVVRARGPSLAQFGVPNTLADPVLTLYSGQTAIASNDDWTLSTNVAAIQASGFAPTNGFESAILVTLNPGAYTAIVTGYNGATGIGIVEVFAVPNQNQVNSQRLIGGTWTFIYTIISTFSDTYQLFGLSPTAGSSGNYLVYGRDSTGGMVSGDYSSTANNWAILDQGSIIDKLYIFTFSSNNAVSGCYYQISPPGSSNISQCYSMSGTRTPPQASPPPDDPEASSPKRSSNAVPNPTEEVLLREGSQAPDVKVSPDESALRIYRALRGEN